MGMYSKVESHLKLFREKENSVYRHLSLCVYNQMYVILYVQTSGGLCEKLSVKLFKCKTNWLKNKEMQFNLGALHCCTQLEIPMLTKQIYLLAFYELHSASSGRMNKTSI